MSSVLDSISSSPATRLDSLASSRDRRVDSARNDGQSFETLLADAVGREMVRRTSEQQRTAAGLPVAPRTRPEGALGASMSSLDGADAALMGTQFSAAGSTSAVGSYAGEAVVAAAAEHLGVPYLWGGTDPEVGLDCSGLVQNAFRDVGVEMPKWSRHQATMGVEIASIEDALPGDVLAFGDPVNHVALYTGEGQMLHAPRTGDVVKVGPIDRPIASIRRIVKPGTTTISAVDPSTAASAAAPTHSASEAERLYEPMFEAAGERWGVDPALLAAVAQTESGFNRYAVSPVGAQGLMQFMPATAAEMGVDPSDPASAIDGAARYLRTSIDQFGSTDLAIASYNAGRGAVSRYGGIPPYNETQNYVEKVNQSWRSRS
ncbi:MAG: transglycosylase SLT domain-containing protein [Acidimicrobiales bacterium]